MHLTGTGENAMRDKRSILTRLYLSVSTQIMRVALIACFVAFQSVAFAAAPIKIGFGIALSGPLAGGGKSGLLAYQMWAEEVNARGGILGRPVQLIYYDDQSNPATVPALYAKLLDFDKVDLVVSPYATNQVAAAMPVIIDRKSTRLNSSHANISYAVF